MKILSIHQPNFFPWIPCLLKESISNLHLVLDHVEYSKNGWTNRCKLNGQYLTIPVDKSSSSKKILDVQISHDERHFKKIKKTLETLPRAAGKSIILDIWEKAENQLYSDSSLINLNLVIRKELLKILEIKTPWQRTSDLQVHDSFKKNDLINHLFIKSKADLYVTGSGGMEYLDDNFKKKCFLIDPVDIGLRKNENDVLTFILHYGSGSSYLFNDLREKIMENLHEQ